MRGTLNRAVPAKGTHPARAGRQSPDGFRRQSSASSCSVIIVPGMPSSNRPFLTPLRIGSGLRKALVTFHVKQSPGRVAGGRRAATPPAASLEQ
ncbi:hypothetical protein Mal4_41490 [Maioricimonas rarisocia]|uniref:Uncharacterized protein n=1 Tax=Maioricimonas rarisocia TaxID=2528026 RepID=A0A517ZBD0_9PLAN|nr:hypothetical protein Mal4_41490 [Maioricimonas rarisocia]